MPEKMDVISNERVRAHLAPETAYRAVERSFTDLAEGTALNESRHRMPLGPGTFNVMWAASEPLEAIALKAYPVVRSDVRQAAGIQISLYSRSTGAMEALLRGDDLGQIRTGAASAVVAAMAGNPDPTTLTVFGTGFQARGQLEAFLSRFPTIQEVFVVGRNAPALTSMVDDFRSRFPGRSIEAAEARPAVEASDLVVTATASVDPLLDGDWLRPGTHVTAVGSNHAAAREVDARTLERCGLVVVDSRQTAEREAGDLIANGFSPSRAKEVSDLVLGAAARTDEREITLFSSQGLAVQDLYAAKAVLDAIEAEGGSDEEPR